MARVKAKEHERITDANIEKVISLLEAEKPITKKAACEILAISYNTARLTSIINNFKDKAEYDKNMREKKRFKPPSPDEIRYVIMECLNGEPVSNISAGIHRSATFVNNILDRVGCPRRSVGSDYWKPEMLPDSCIKESFKEGEKVYSARYDSVATVRAEIEPGKYRLWLEGEKWQQFAYQPWWELGSLEHLKQYGVKI